MEKLDGLTLEELCWRLHSLRDQAQMTGNPLGRGLRITAVRKEIDKLLGIMPFVELFCLRYSLKNLSKCIRPLNFKNPLPRKAHKTFLSQVNEAIIARDCPHIVKRKKGA